MLYALNQKVSVGSNLLNNSATVLKVLIQLTKFQNPTKEHFDV
jgi:hypothetical protein